MPVADNVPRIDELILSGMMATAAFAQVSEETGISKGSLTTAYYREKAKLGVKKPLRRRPRAPRAAKKVAPAATNGRVTTQDLLARLRSNRLEHEAIMEQLERTVADDVAALARVRQVLGA